uniref:CD109 molecule n=1 Tax=Fundulus heteroclitus TaxID=8078 RepID=A0A3Q2P6C8_FUNHE
MQCLFPEHQLSRLVWLIPLPSFCLSATLFLVSGPYVLHAGLHTPIAVTVFADFPGNVTAEVTHGSTKFPGSLSQNTLLNLTVRGYGENCLLFTNTTTLTFNLRTVLSFIQTDRSSYKPGDAVKVRVVSLQLDNKPYKGRVEISLTVSINRPEKGILTSFRSMGTHSFSSAETSFSLCTPPQRPATKVMFYTLLPRSKIAPRVCFILNYSFDKHLLRFYNILFSVAVAPGFTLNKTVQVHVFQNKFQLMFLDFPSTLKPSLNFSANVSRLRIVRYDGKSLSSLDLKHSAVVEVTQRTSSTNSTTMSLTLPVPENGNVLIEFKTQDQVEMLFLRVSIESYSKGQVIAAGTKNFSSSIALTPELSWYPEACVTVYYNHYGEIISDTTYISMYNHVRKYIFFQMTARARPGEQVSLSVAASESWFQVGIVVMAMQNEMEKKKTLKFDLISDFLGKFLDWTELFLLHAGIVILITKKCVQISQPPSTSLALRSVALVMSENLGLSFTPVPQKLTISKDFSLSLVVPPYLIRGEEIVLEVNVINHLEQDIEVSWLDASVINAQRLTLGRDVSVSALFPIRALAVGEMEISVDAVSADASDGLVRKIWVKPEGVEQTVSHTLLLEVAPHEENSSRSMSFSFPPNLVQGSQRAHVALVGDILALSIEHLDSLIQLPTGCGEQNMIHFAPSVYVLQYLEMSTQNDAKIRSKALSHMVQGYEKQLSFLREDGSFSAFGENDTSGSTWLTAFVLRCFLQAQPFMQIDKTVLAKAAAWLVKHQGSQGEFSEVGEVIHTAMQGGLDDSVALTAYVVLGFHEDKEFSVSQRDSGVVSNYSLCLAAYALALSGSPTLESVISELKGRADDKDGVMMWTVSGGLGSNKQQQRSAQIEMASYVLLALFVRGNFIEGISLMKWLSMQRSYLGGFGTTQDTVVAFQALAYYAAFSGAGAINLRFNVSSPVSSSVSLFYINPTNYRVYQNLPLNIYMEGRGFATFQVNIFYNVNSTQVVGPVTDEDAFTLDVNLTNSDSDQMMLSVCTRLKDNQAIDRTGMAILDVGMFSGFSLLPGAAIQANFIKKVVTAPERVTLYLDSVNKTEVCVSLPLVRNYKVAHVQDTVLQVYDYYEPSEYNCRQLSCYKYGLIFDLDIKYTTGHHVNLLFLFF